MTDSLDQLGSTLTAALPKMKSPTNKVAYPASPTSKFGGNGSPSNLAAAKARMSQLDQNMVPHQYVERTDVEVVPAKREALDDLMLEGGYRIWRDTGGLMSNMSHLDLDLKPKAPYDAGIGCEGYYTNGLPEGYVRPDRLSQMVGASMRPTSKAKEWEAGWYMGGRNGNFSLPVVHHKRPEKTSPKEPDVLKYEDIDFKPAIRARAVPRTSRFTATGNVHNINVEDANRWCTSYDCNFSPMNEREADQRRRRALAKSKRSNKKKKRTFDWRRRASNSQPTPARAGGQPKPVWRGGARPGPAGSPTAVAR